MGLIAYPGTSGGGGDLAGRRAALIADQWPSGLPSTGPDTVTTSWGGSPVVSSAVARVDRWEFTLPDGLTNEAHLYRPTSPVSPARVLIVHGGHGLNVQGYYWKTEYGGNKLFDAFCGAGFYVLGCSMPLCGYSTAPQTMNGVPVVYHNDWKTSAEDVGRKTLPYLLDHVIRSVNRIRSELGATARVFMTGLSGGGWTTTWAPAVDARIERGYAVAGGIPTNLRHGECNDPGDYEQQDDGINANGAAYASVRPWYALVGGWNGLFALAASGGRKHVQVLNTKDACCFAVNCITQSGRYDREGLFRAYERAVQAQLGYGAAGTFLIRFDGSHPSSHEISTDTRAFILADMTAA